jgi:hypothetical protein
MKSFLFTNSSKKNKAFRAFLLKDKKSIFKYMKSFFLRAIAFLAAFVSFNQKTNNTPSVQSSSTGVRGASAATRSFGNPHFYMALRYKRGKNGKVMAWS